MTAARLRLAAAAALILVAVFAPLILYSSLVGGTIDREVSARSAEDRLATAGIAAASIDRDLADAGDDLVLLTSSAAVRSAVIRRDPASLDTRLTDLLHGRPNSLGAIFDAKGTVLAAPLARELVGQDFSARDYFRGALTSDGPYISEIFTSASAGNPSVVGVSLAIREAGAVIGVVVITLMPTDLLRVLAPLRHVEGRELLIIDPAGRVVASTDATLAPLAPTALSADANGTSQGEVEVGGRQRVATTGPIERSRWTLYVLDDPAVVLRGQRELLTQLRGGGLWIGLLALAMTAALAFAYSRIVRQGDELRAGRAALAGSNRALEEASRHKSDFLASMSHELRTPLNAILGFSDLLLEQLGGSINDRQGRYLRNIKEAGSHLLGLINDVLDLSKVEAGRMELRPERTTLSAVVSALVQSTRASADTRNITFESDVGGGVQLSVDAARLRQILYNLLSNAVKFTPPGGRVRLRAAARGRDLEIEVADTGIGIPEAVRDRVFGTFERLHEGRFDAGGTGLGLALTKQLVELHGGTIYFASLEGEGTTFHVRLPDVVVAALGRERVLVVEDDPRDAQLVAALAAKVGLDSEVVATSDAALESIRRSPPLVVVLDMRLGDQRGERVLEVVRGRHGTERIPVIVVTVEDDTGRSMELGADAHLTKPIDPAVLTERLARARRARKEVAVAASAGR